MHLRAHQAALFMPEWGGNESNLYNVMNDAIPGTTWDQKELSSQVRAVSAWHSRRGNKSTAAV